MITIPFASCIDINNTELADASSIVKIYRTAGYGSADEQSVYNDPMFGQYWLMFSNGGTMYNLSDYLLNYASWMTLSQIRNTISTDLAFREGINKKTGHKELYINGNMTSPAAITIEYIPKMTTVTVTQDSSGNDVVTNDLNSQVLNVTSDYWIDILIRMSVALVKITLGRIRTRFTQGNALYTQDGEKLLEEGNTALNELREVLRANSNLVYMGD